MLAASNLFVMDLARETYAANTRPQLSHINVGTGEDIAISELAEMIADVTGFKGEITYDRDKPDGTPRKLMDVSRLTRLGWQAETPLHPGITATYRWYLDKRTELREA